MKKIALLSLLACISVPSYAAESVFGFARVADPLPADAREGYVRLTHRWDKGEGTFRANDLRLGAEFGVTDKFSYGVWVQGLDIKGKNAFPPSADGEEVYPFDIDYTGFQSVGGEVKYNFLSPYKDGWGLSIVAEVYTVRRYAKIDGSRTRQWSFEPQIIVQKNFLDDQLVTTYNVAVESERRVFPDADNAKETEFSITHNLGISYRFAPKFYAGFEGRHHMDIVNGEKNHYDIFAGPTALYGNENWYIQATYLRQLKGSPTYSGYDVQPDPAIYDIDTGLHLEEDSKNEFRLKVGFKF